MIKYVISLFLLFGLANGQDYELEQAFPNLNFNRPVLLTYAPDNSNRIFVVEQRGNILVFPNNPSATSQDVDTLLNIRGRISLSPYSENGLLGLAFHPNYSENGLFFVNYMREDIDSSFVSQFKVSDGDPNSADMESEVVLIRVKQPLENHNAGMLSFGPDGYLYISFGDGGWQYPSGPPDPAGNSQDFTTMLAKMLRIDVDNTQGDLNYAIPPDNPYVGNDEGILEEIFASGFRNPWRFSIDMETGDIWMGDVGFNNFEEINLVESGKNYGWVIMEGVDCLEGTSCDTTGYTKPLFFLEHPLSQSITGGYVYRGTVIPELIGKYIYGDYVTRHIWSLEVDGETVTNTLLTTANADISAFGQDQNKELYVVTLNFNDLTKIYKLKSNITALEGASESTKSFSLEQNYPNPFNPITRISYQVKDAGQLKIVIYDLEGKVVNTLLNKFHSAGSYSVDWNGINKNGEKVSAGMYFYRLVSSNLIVTKKMTLLK